MSDLVVQGQSQVFTVTIEQKESIASKVIANNGNLANLTAVERKQYYLAMAAHYGLDPFSNPFDYLEQKTREGVKLTLYPNQKAAYQWASRNKISTSIVTREFVEGLCITVVRAKSPDGRTADATGAAEMDGFGGKATAIKKAETQARRRAILVLCGHASTDEDDRGNYSAEAYDPPIDAMDLTQAVTVDALPSFDRAPTYAAISKNLKRLKITPEKASEMIQKDYQCSNRDELSDAQLIDFADYLARVSTPVAEEVA